MIATCNSRFDNQRQVLGNGLVSGFGYPIGRLEMIDGECLVELLNPWSTGDWAGRWGRNSKEFQNANAMNARILAPTQGTKNFWMSITDFCTFFTDAVETRTVSPYWQAYVVNASTDCLSYPLISVSQETHAVLVLSQSDRRWTKQDDQENSIGLRIYRCRIVAPSHNATGMRQNTSNPFNNMELCAQCEPMRGNTAMVEIQRMDPRSLYIACIESSGRSKMLSLRMHTSCAFNVRDLTGQERQYLSQAQDTAPRVFDREDSEEYQI
jgi:hypothetical protein